MYGRVLSGPGYGNVGAQLFRSVMVEFMKAALKMYSSVAAGWGSGRGRERERRIEGEGKRGERERGREREGEGGREEGRGGGAAF